MTLKSHSVLNSIGIMILYFSANPNQIYHGKG
jgi:hypothetical protein